jgi:hypothetical protein
MSEQVGEFSVEQARQNREEFKRRLKEEGRLEPFQQEQEQEKKERPQEFHGFQ